MKLIFGTYHRDNLSQRLLVLILSIQEPRHSGIYNLHPYSPFDNANRPTFLLKVNLIQKCSWPGNAEGCFRRGHLGMLEGGPGGGGHLGSGWRGGGWKAAWRPGCPQFSTSSLSDRAPPQTSKGPHQTINTPLVFTHFTFLQKL